MYSKTNVNNRILTFQTKCTKSVNHSGLYEKIFATNNDRLTKSQANKSEKVKCGGSMHIFCNVQEGGVEPTLGCREGGGHQRARSSCEHEERERVTTTETLGHSPYIVYSVLLVYHVFKGQA